MARGKVKAPRTTTNADKEIGIRLRSLRLDRNMSQEELALKLGVSFQQVQKYEKGVNRLSAGRLLQVAKVLQTSPHEILGWDGARLIDVAFDIESYKLAKAFRGLPEALKVPMRALINSMIVEVEV